MIWLPYTKIKYIDMRKARKQKGGNLASNAAKLAQLAKGITEIIKGALTGGLKGAAIAVAKNFAPQIIKAIIIILVILLLLPSILFFALPNIFFQWSSVDDADVVAMNEQSQLIGNIYDRMDGFTQDEANKIITELSAGYDETVVASDFSNINHYWLIAISTVLHEQSMSIGEDQVRGMIRQNMDYSYTRSLRKLTTSQLEVV